MCTGEKIGLLSFSSKPGFTAESFEETGARTSEDAYRERGRSRSTPRPCRGRLKANSNEVRYMRGLGLGFRGR